MSMIDEVARSEIGNLKTSIKEIKGTLVDVKRSRDQQIEDEKVMIRQLAGLEVRVILVCTIATTILCSVIGGLILYFFTN